MFGLFRALLGGVIAFRAKDGEYDKHMLKLGDTSICCRNNVRIGRVRGHGATVAPRCMFAVSTVMAFPHHVVDARFSA